MYNDTPSPQGRKKPLIIAVCALLLFGGAFGLWKLTSNNPEQPKTSASITDKQAPSIAIDDIDSLQSGELSGIITITVTAKDNVGVSKVEFYLDDEFLAVTYASPFSLQLDTSKVEAGKHALEAKAYDEAGNQAVSKKITFTVSSTETPAATSSSPKAAPAKSTSPSNTSPDSGDDTPPTPPDTTPPTAPANLTLTADGAYVAKATWTASTDNVGVTSYKVYRDGAVLGTTTTTSYNDYTVVPGNTYDYLVKAYDAANNSTSSATEPAITMAETSIWMSFDQPQAFGNDGSALEMGVKFRALADGKITGVRFYKASGDTGIHTGNLWDSAGTNLATATFSSETASGWQQVSFATPVDITAGQTYVASFLTPEGKYGYTTDYFVARGITSQYLTALASGVDGNNGVFKSGAGFPTTSFNNTNYWVDVSFTPNLGAGGPAVTLADDNQVFSGYPGSDNTGVVGKRLPTRDRAPQLVTNGVTVSNVEIREENIAHVNADNITFSNVKFTYTGAGSGLEMIDVSGTSTGTTFSDCEFDGQGDVERAILGVSEITIQRCNIHGVANGIAVETDLTVEDSYIHDISTPAGQLWPANGITVASTTSNVTIRDNTVFLDDDQVAALDLQGGAPDSLTDVLVTGNLIAGGEYTVRIGAGTNTNVEFTGNKLSSRYYPKVGNTNIYFTTWLTGVTVTGNTIYETGAAADSNL